MLSLRRTSLLLGAASSSDPSRRFASQHTTISDRVDGIVVKLGKGDIAQIHDDILMVTPPHVRAHFKIIDSDLPLPTNVVAFSPILQLLPHGFAFAEEPVLLIMRVCAGAQAAWRSSPEGGWKPVPEVDFYPGYAVIKLRHFCELFLGTDGTAEPRPTGIMVHGFVDEGMQMARCAVSHENCPACDTQLSQIAPQLLRDYEVCAPPRYIGEYSDGDGLAISQGSLEEPLNLHFNRLPLVTNKPFVSQAARFEAGIVQLR